MMQKILYQISRKVKFLIILRDHPFLHQMSRKVNFPMILKGPSIYIM